MGKRILTTVVVGVVLSVAASLGMADSVVRSADKLVKDQSGAGDWGEAGFAGESIIGLCHAHEVTGNESYKTAAEKGGAYSLSFGSSELFPAEAYAMARLSAIQDDPSNNPWRTALVDNLNATDPDATITSYQANPDVDVSIAVYDVARMAVAANYVDHADASAWREGVIALLGGVDDDAGSPVMALGAAVWALALTGDISKDTTVVWAKTGVLVKDLPGILAGRQRLDGSFYAALYSDVDSGYTETTVMATLGATGCRCEFLLFAD